VFRRVFLSLLAAALVAPVALTALVAGRTRPRLVEESAARLRSEIGLLRALVRAQADPAALQAALARAAGPGETRFTVVGPGGEVIADSHAAPGGMESHRDRPEILEARRSGEGRAIRFSATLGKKLLYVASPLDARDPSGAVLRAALPLERVEEQIGALYRGIAAGLAGTVAVAAGVAWVLARRLTRPVRQIRDVARAIYGRDVETPAPLVGRDELDTVGEALRRMGEELERRLERLRQERSKLEAVLLSMQEGVIATGPEGDVRHLNASAAAMFGVGSEVVGLRIWEAVRHPALEGAVRAALGGKGASRETLEFGARALEISACPVAGGQGAVIVARDVTEERRYERLRREFVANVSHELRTPLSIVRGYVETLREGAWQDPAAAPEFLAAIESNVRRLEALTADLLDLSKLESGGAVLRARAVDLGELLRRVQQAFEPLARRKRQSLDLEVGEGPGDLVADPELLERAVSNLVDNAVKYTPEGGRIRLSAAGEAAAVRIAVEDDGVGIPEVDLPRIFERFYRVDKSRSRELGGTGLGLAIVKHVAQLHGGRVDVRSRPGEGSCFTLVLPRHPAAAAGPGA
jgi:two-component system phosphate regulon sensor histidine kinase PhoR